MSVRALVLWVARQGWTLRFRARGEEICSGEIFTDETTLEFQFFPQNGQIELPDRTLYVDPHGWEVDEDGNIVFRSRRLSNDERRATEK